MRASVYSCALDDNLQMHLPEEKRRPKSTVSVSAPHIKTAERMVPRTVLQQFLVTPQ